MQKEAEMPRKKSTQVSQKETQARRPRTRSTSSLVEEKRPGSSLSQEEIQKLTAPREGTQRIRRTETELLALSARRAGYGPMMVSESEQVDQAPLEVSLTSIETTDVEETLDQTETQDLSVEETSTETSIVEEGTDEIQDSAADSTLDAEQTEEERTEGMKTGAAARTSELHEYMQESLTLNSPSRSSKEPTRGTKGKGRKTKKGSTPERPSPLVSRRSLKRRRVN